MQKYKIFIHGRNLLADFEGVRQRLDFFTNVFVEAYTSEDAAARVIDLVRDDVQLQEMILNTEDDPLSIAVDEVREIDTFNGVRLPRTGFSFCPAKS